jgi:hypothetical protein
MPVIPDIDPATCTLEEVVALTRAHLEQRAVIRRNIEVAEAMLARGQTTFPFARCPDCPDSMEPVRDDDTIECPVHGVIAGLCPHDPPHES